MTRPVNDKSDLRTLRKADTEQRIIAAAARMFQADGYAATTLSGVAAAAGVGDRTVYVRFGTKAELLKRAIGVALVGDLLPVDVAGREWSIRASSAPTLQERVAAYADGARGLMERAGALIAVAQQAEATEPEIAQAAQAAREDTVVQIRRFWERLRADGLMHVDADLEWVVATSTLLGAAQTYVLMTQMLRWDPPTYREWLYRTWMQLATMPSGDRASGT